MLSEQQAMSLIADGAIKLPPLEVDFVAAQPLVRGSCRVDWMLDVRWGERTRRYAVEYKNVGTPRMLDVAVQQITSALESTAGLLPMVMAPHLSETKLDALAARGVSGIDLCGNAVVLAPGEWSFYRSGKPNRFPSTAPIKKVYVGTSSLVGRILFNQRRFERLLDVQKGIEKAGAKISLGTVSKVISSLEAELIVSKKDGICLVQPEILLDRLAGEYEPKAPLVRMRGRFRDAAAGRSERQLLLQRATAWAADAGVRFALAGQTRYAKSSSSDAYPLFCTDDASALAEQFGFEEASRWADAEIRGTRDPLVYFDARQIEGVTWQSPLQTYLEMMQGGKRERELATAVRAQLLDLGGAE